MLSREEKITFLIQILDTIKDNYAASFKTDILLFFEEFDPKNPNLKFLTNLATKQEIENWIDKLTSRIVMKEDLDSVNEIICDYIELG